MQSDRIKEEMQSMINDTDNYALNKGQEDQKNQDMYQLMLE